MLPLIALSALAFTIKQPTGTPTPSASAEPDGIELIIAFDGEVVEVTVDGETSVGDFFVLERWDADLGDFVVVKQWDATGEVPLDDLDIAGEFVGVKDWVGIEEVTLVFESSQLGDFVVVKQWDVVGIAKGKLGELAMNF